MIVTNFRGQSFPEERNIAVVCEHGLDLDHVLGTNSSLFSCETGIE